MVEKVVAYRSVDGRRFDTEAEALAHENRGRIYRILSEGGVALGGTWTLDMYVDFLVSNADTMVQALKPIADAQRRELPPLDLETPCGGLTGEEVVLVGGGY